MEGADMSNLLSGLSCRQAAIRFGVSASSAIRGRMMERVQGGATPKAFLARPALDARTVMRVPIRALVDETPDITLEELRTALAARHLWQATARCAPLSPPQDHAQTRPRTAPSRIARTS
jgi:transposase